MTLVAVRRERRGGERASGRRGCARAYIGCAGVQGEGVRIYERLFVKPVPWWVLGELKNKILTNCKELNDGEDSKIDLN